MYHQQVGVGSNSKSSKASSKASSAADSDLINTDEDEDEKKVVELGEFLTDLAHELFKIVKELTKNKKN